MTLTTWNLDHPAQATRRFNAIRDHLLDLDSDVLILTEANAALDLPGYQAVFSEASPFIRRGRIIQPPNRYHQVAIYARWPIRKLSSVEDINGVAAEVGELCIYGTVLTIKDRWADWSDKRYTDRVAEQCAIIRKLQASGFLAAGDFNFRGTGSYNKVGRERVGELVAETVLSWPTRREERTVQHVLHSPDLKVTYEVRDSDGLSDHPVVVCKLRVKGNHLLY